MQVVLRESLVATSGQQIDITVTLAPGDHDAEGAWREALDTLARLAGQGGQAAFPVQVDQVQQETQATPTSRHILGAGRSQGPESGAYAAGERDTRANVVWTQPDLHGKTLKTVHRVALAIHELTEARRTPNVDNITAKARTSRPPVYNIADPTTPAGRYMAPYVVSQKIGREIVLDLTPKGRQLVSLIRAGKVPA